jgi:hypothetical protein
MSSQCPSGHVPDTIETRDLQLKDITVIVKIQVQKKVEHFSNILRIAPKVLQIAPPRVDGPQTQS